MTATADHQASGVQLGDSARWIVQSRELLFENFHIGNCRSETRSAFSLSPLRSPIVLLGALGALGIHTASMHLPLLQNILGTQPVSLETWAVTAILAVSVVPAIEIHKYAWAARKRRPPPVGRSIRLC